MRGWRLGAERDHERGAARECARKREETRRPIIARGERISFASRHIRLAAPFDQQVADHEDNRHAESPRRHADHPRLQVKPDRAEHEAGQNGETRERLTAITERFPQAAAALAELIEEICEKSSHCLRG